MDVSSCYQNVKHDKKPSCLTMFSCQFGGIHTKDNQISIELDNLFAVPDNILILGYHDNGVNHDRTKWKILQTYRKENLKLNNNKYHFRCTRHSIFRQNHFRVWHKALMDMSQFKSKKELQTFLGIINYLSKFSPTTAEVCAHPCRLMSRKTKWSWNRTYQDLFKTAKTLTKKDVCMKWYDETGLLYLETDAPGLWLGAGLQ